MAKSEARTPDGTEIRFLQNGGENLKSPCQDCPDRHLRCHSSCGDYAAFREYRDNIIAARAALGEMADYDLRNRTRALRKARKNRMVMGIDCLPCKHAAYDKRRNLYHCEKYGAQLHGGKAPMRCLECMKEGKWKR